MGNKLFKSEPGEPKRDMAPDNTLEAASVPEELLEFEVLFDIVKQCPL
jgi:hypothetical protein